MEFFRHCPGCGRRFHIKLESKEMIHLERETPKDRYKAGAVVGGDSRFPTPFVLHLQEGMPVVTDVEEFQYMYKCTHCGHEWTEKHLEEHREHR